MSFFFALFWGSIAAAINIFGGGYTIFSGWAWFVVPLGVAPIGFWHALGLQSLLTCFLGLRGVPSDISAVEDKTKVEKRIQAVVFPALLYGMAFCTMWLFHHININGGTINWPTISF